MAQNHKDPNSYLNDAVVSRGKSARFGVYLTNVTVVAEANQDYNYKIFSQASELDNPFPDWNFESSLIEWFLALIRLRSNKQEDASFTVGGRIFQFLVEGSVVSLNVFQPEAFVDSFQYDVSHAQQLLRMVADFLGKSATTVRFNIGKAHKSWTEMSDEGDVQEFDYFQ